MLPHSSTAATIWRLRRSGTGGCIPRLKQKSYEDANLLHYMNYPCMRAASESRIRAVLTIKQSRLMSEKADILVIGLGAMGSAALYQLAKRGVKAVGLDRFAPPHTMGSSHGETRITRQ